VVEPALKRAAEQMEDLADASVCLAEYSESTMTKAVDAGGRELLRQSPLVRCL